MSQNPTASDWAAARGDKWSAELSHMEAMFLPVDEPLLRALRLDGPLRIAEIGCGGGATALAISRRAPAGSVVHGFDVSRALIEKARIAQARAGVATDAGSLVFRVADMATRAPESPYDRLVSRFGVMFFDDPEAAFANLVRWLAPGGRFAFAVWGPVSENPWMTTVRDAVAQIVDLPAADPKGPGPFRYADADTFRAVLARAGFAKVEVEEWRGALPIGGGLAPAEAARFSIAGFSAFGEFLAKAGDEAVREGHRAVTARFAEAERDGVVRLDGCVRVFSGLRA